MSVQDPYDQEAIEQQQADARSAAQLAQHTRKEDLKWLMDNERGRRFMLRLLDRTGLRKEPMTGNSQTFYNLGAVAIGRELEGEIFAHCPEQYLKMITESST